jgi:hypothetical protein
MDGWFIYSKHRTDLIIKGLEINFSSLPSSHKEILGLKYPHISVWDWHSLKNAGCTFRHIIFSLPFFISRLKFFIVELIKILKKYGSPLTWDKFILLSEVQKFTTLCIYWTKTFFFCRIWETKLGLYQGIKTFYFTQSNGNKGPTNLSRFHKK